MGTRVLRQFGLILLCILLGSGSSIAENPPVEAVKQNKIMNNQKNQILFSSPVFTTQFDTTIPIVNPTTPGTTIPIINPPSPPAPIYGEPTPTITPVTPITTPTITPVTPITTPTTPTTTPVSTGGTWCIASSTASETALQVALDYACGYGGADCSGIQPSGSCYNPNTVRDHASYAFNVYYHKNPVPTSCAFGGTAQLTYVDPSTGNCRFPSSVTSSTTPSTTPPVIPSPTLTPMTPLPPTTYGGATVYGSEPTALPSSASSVSCSLLLLITMIGLLGAANNL